MREEFWFDDVEVENTEPDGAERLDNPRRRRRRKNSHRRRAMSNVAPRRRRRANPHRRRYRRNPPPITDAVVDALKNASGYIGVNLAAPKVGELIGIAPVGIMGIALKAGLALGGGMLLEKFVGRDMGRAWITGGMLNAGMDFLTQMGVLNAFGLGAYTLTDTMKIPFASMLTPGVGAYNMGEYAPTCEITPSPETMLNGVVMSEELPDRLRKNW